MANHNHQHVYSEAENVERQIAGLPEEFATLRDTLPPPEFRAEVDRILTVLGKQVARFRAREYPPERVDAMEAGLAALAAAHAQPVVQSSPEVPAGGTQRAKAAVRR